MTETFESENDKIHISKDGKTVIFGKVKKEWMRLPKELGGIKVKVIDQFGTRCRCTKHDTTAYILKSKYCTMFCDEVGQWAWILKPATF
ncbi:MAG: hypothetical protein Harvfovirus26_6 [Harvfovirus sp.]|uniref:Uncharacterized protein n=1 Tax=Harvfovirus sp. TaxID=2487768 RepID=A0A3G5A241_9VIRU|nr:MAG: hypothetical protein Harvfovirus26_6 [Harvfovirus sp.]